MSHSLDYQNGKMLVALNRLGMEGGVKSADIASSLHKDLFVEIPDGGSKVSLSINRGVPLLLRYPRNATSKAIQNLGKKLVTLEVLDRVEAA